MDIKRDWVYALALFGAIVGALLAVALCRLVGIG